MNKTVSFLMGLFVVFSAQTAIAGNWEFFAKSGYFRWEEKLENERIIYEHGPLFALGLEWHSQPYDRLGINVSAELWGGVIRYNGIEILDLEAKYIGKGGYIGLKPEVTIDVAIIKNERFKLSPFVGIGYKTWLRTKATELWQMSYVPIGVYAERKISNKHLYISIAQIIPIDTRYKAYVSKHTEFEDFAIKLKADKGIAGEIGMKFSSWDISISYEKMSLDVSGIITTQSLDREREMMFLHPQTDTYSTWLKVGYNF